MGKRLKSTMTAFGPIGTSICTLWFSIFLSTFIYICLDGRLQHIFIWHNFVTIMCPNRKRPVYFTSWLVVTMWSQQVTNTFCLGARQNSALKESQLSSQFTVIEEKNKFQWLTTLFSKTCTKNTNKLYNYNSNLWPTSHGFSWDQNIYFCYHFSPDFY